MFRTFLSITLLLIAGVVFMMYTRPAYDGIAAKQAEIADYNAALDKAAELQKIKQTLLSKYNSMNPDDIKRLEKLLPDHVDNVALILDIDHLAGEHNMSLENVDVSVPTAAAGQSSPATSPVIGPDSSKKYDSLTITFTTHATYQNFLSFLRDLQSSLRIVDLTSLSIAPGGAVAGAGSSDPVYTYTITLRTYWLK